MMEKSVFTEISIRKTIIFKFSTENCSEISGTKGGDQFVTLGMGKKGGTKMFQKSKGGIKL